MEQPTNNRTLSAIRPNYGGKSIFKSSTTTTSGSHVFACPSTPKTRRGYTEGGNLHDLGERSPETSPRRIINLTKEMAAGCMSPMLASSKKCSKNLFGGEGATPSSSGSSSCQEVISDDEKWETLKLHMRRRSRGGYTPMALGENLNDLLDTASNHERRSGNSRTSDV